MKPVSGSVKKSIRFARWIWNWFQCESKTGFDNRILPLWPLTYSLTDWPQSSKVIQIKSYCTNTRIHTHPANCIPGLVITVVGKHMLLIQQQLQQHQQHIGHWHRTIGAICITSRAKNHTCFLSIKKTIILVILFSAISIVTCGKMSYNTTKRGFRF